MNPELLKHLTPYQKPQVDVAIICSTIPARLNLLYRSMQTWESSIQDSKLNCSICVHSVETPELGYLNSFSKNLRLQHLPHRTGSHIAGYNYWTDRIDAKVYLYTHPDLLFPLDTIRVAYETAMQRNTFAAFKVFWMPQQMTEEIEKYYWRHPEMLEYEASLYPLYSNGHGEFYWNKDVRDKKEWHSTTTFAIDSDLAHLIYPMPDLAVQGYDDPLHYMIRMNAGVQDVCIMNPVLMHQWHPQTWNGNAQLAVKQARELYEEHYAERIKERK